MKKRNCKTNNRGIWKKLLSGEVFCIGRSCSFPLASEQSKVLYALFQQWLQNCTSARAGLLAAVQCFSWNTRQQKAKGRSQDLTTHPALQQLKASEQPQAELRLTQTKGCSSLWSRIDNQKHHNFIIKAKYYPLSSQSTSRAIAPSRALSPNAVQQILLVTHRERKCSEDRTLHNSIPLMRYWSDANCNMYH